MDNADRDLETTCEPDSREALLSLDAEVRERLDIYYAQIEFLEDTSAAIHKHLHHDFYSNPADEDEITSDAGYTACEDSDDNQHYSEEDFDSGEPDTECYDDFAEEQFEDEEGEYEGWDGNDEYYD